RVKSAHRRTGGHVLVSRGGHRDRVSARPPIQDEDSRQFLWAYGHQGGRRRRANCLDLFGKSSFPPASPAFVHADSFFEPHLLQHFSREGAPVPSSAVAENPLVSVLESLVPFVMLEVCSYLQEASRNVNGPW